MGGNATADVASEWNHRILEMLYKEGQLGSQEDLGSNFNSLLLTQIPSKTLPFSEPQFHHL